MAEQIQQKSQQHSALSAEEARLYDRQLRLWGVESQQRMQASHVLLVGINGLMAELAKNIVLAGVKHISLADSMVTSPLDLSSHLLLTQQHLGLNRAEASLARLSTLNPLAVLKSHTLDAALWLDQLCSLIHQGGFDLVVVSGPDNASELARINAATRAASAAFMVLNGYGSFGWSFFDLGDEHTFHVRPPGTADQLPPNALAATTAPRSQRYWPISPLWFQHVSRPEDGKTASRHALVWAWVALESFKLDNNGRLPSSSDLSELRTICNQLVETHKIPRRSVPTDQHLRLVTMRPGQVAPLTAVLGGIIAQEVIKYLTKMDPPLHNTLWYEAMTGENSVELLLPS